MPRIKIVAAEATAGAPICLSQPAVLHRSAPRTHTRTPHYYVALRTPG